MGKKEIIDIIRSFKPEMESRDGVQRLGLFGSYV
jgi:predicted nucleotidyltransferase